MNILEKLLDGIDVSYDQKCVPLLLLSGQELEARLTRISGKFGLTYLQNLILHYLVEGEEDYMTINELSDCLAQKANTSRSVAQLVKSGLVTKTRSDDDERVVYVSVTEKGKALKEEVEASLGSLKSLGLNEEDAKAFFDLLIKVMTFQATQDI